MANSLQLDDGKSFKAISAGTHLAALISVVDLGDQVEQFQDQDPKAKRQLWLQFEVPGETTDDGRPLVQGTTLNVSFHPRAKLVKWLSSWGHPPKRGFDIANLLGKPVLLLVEQYENKHGDMKAKITGLAAPSKGQKIDKLHNETVCFAIEDGSPAKSPGWDKLPEWTQKKILAGAEDVAALKAGTWDKEPAKVPDADIPF